MLETDKFENYNNIQIIETCHNILENIKNKVLYILEKKLIMIKKYYYNYVILFGAKIY